MGQGDQVDNLALQLGDACTRGADSCTMRGGGGSGGSAIDSDRGDNSAAREGAESRPKAERGLGGLSAPA